MGTFSRGLENRWRVINSFDTNDFHIFCDDVDLAHAEGTRIVAFPGKLTSISQHCGLVKLFFTPIVRANHLFASNMPMAK
jgi:hypothetical protein